MTAEYNIFIRRAVRTDCPRMLALVQELAVFERAPQEVTVTEAHFEESGFGALPVWWAFVAVVIPENGVEEIIGFGLYYIRYSTWKGQKMYLEDLLVTEAWRGLGAGKKLMAALIAEAKERSFTGIGWQVLEWNAPAITFYEQYGARFDAEWLNVGIDI